MQIVERSWHAHIHVQLDIVWKTKGKNTFNFVIGMLAWNRCKRELMNMSSMELVFVGIKFIFVGESCNLLQIQHEEENW